MSDIRSLWIGSLIVFGLSFVFCLWVVADPKTTLNRDKLNAEHYDFILIIFGLTTSFVMTIVSILALVKAV